MKTKINENVVSWDVRSLPPRRLFMDGGLIQGATGFAPGEKWEVIDYDIDGNTDPKETCKCNAGMQPDGKVLRHYHSWRECNEKGEY